MSGVTRCVRPERFCPEIWDSTTVQAVLKGGDYAVTAATSVPQEDIREVIPVTDNNLLLLDDDEEAEKCDWYNEHPAENFGNLDIDWDIEICLSFSQSVI